MELLSDNVSGTSEFQQKFESKLSEYERQHQGSLRKPWTEERVLEVMNNIRQARVSMSSNHRSMSSNHRATSMDYYWISKYDIMTIADKEHLIYKRNSANEPTVRIISRNDYFHNLIETHKACGHGGRDKIIHTIKSKFYIPKKAIEIFLALCPSCGNKKNITKKGTVTQPQPIVSQDFNIRGQVDLIDFCCSPYGEFKWLLNYQDITTKFVSLRPLKTKNPNEVAVELMKIFTIFGAPYILQSNNGRAFAAKIVVELTTMWPECRIVHGSLRRAQGIVEKGNPDVENMLRAWMSAHNSASWSLGCHFVQYKNNASYHRSIGKSPHKALFGRDTKTGLISSSMPSSMLVNIETEEQLINLTKEVHSDKDSGQSITNDEEPYEDETFDECGENCESSSRSDGLAGKAEVGTDFNTNSTQPDYGNDLMHTPCQVSEYCGTENPGIEHNNDDQFSESFKAENFKIATADHYESIDTPPPNYSSHKSRKRTISDEKSDEEGVYSFTKRLGQNSNDEFDIYAQYVASELRHTRDLHSVLIAKHNINNILFNARMGKYRRRASSSTSAQEVREGPIKIERDAD